jgi:hypothetical protein
MAHEFSVYQYFVNGQYEKVREYVELNEAMKAAEHYSNNVAVKMGITARVIVTDGGDCIVWEWKQGEGIVWPKPPFTE